MPKVGSRPKTLLPQPSAALRTGLLGKQFYVRQWLFCLKKMK